MSVSKRIYQGLGANAFGQAVTIIMQLISVPILISVWGIEKYGEWLVISTIPAYMAFSDLGLTTASANKIAVYFEKGRHSISRRLYQTCFVIVNFVCFFFLMIVGILGATFDSVTFLNIQNFSNVEFMFLLMGLFFHVLLTMATSVFAIPFRAIKKNPIAIVLINCIRLVEWSLALCLVFYTSSAYIMVVALVFVRMLGAIAMLFFSRAINPILSLSKFTVDKRAISILMRPALASMLFPIGLSLTIQGAILLISMSIGGSGVAIFNIYRTISRLLIQGVSVINQSIWPELSYAYARSKVSLILNLIKRANQISILSGIVFVLLVYKYADVLMALWVRERIDSNNTLLALMLCATFIHVIWQKYWVFLMATNNHIRFSQYFLGVSVLTFVLIALFLKMYGLYGSAIGLVIGELLCWFFSRKYYRRIIMCM